MKSDIISTTADSISSGGTVTGDLTVEGDFVVEGGGSLSVDAAVSGKVKIDQDSNAGSLLIDSEATSNDIMSFDAPTSNSGHIIHMSGCDALTTGSALRVDCGSANLASTSSGGLVEILHDANSGSTENNLLFINNDHASSTGTIGLLIRQDS